MRRLDAAGYVNSQKRITDTNAIATPTGSKMRQRDVIVRDEDVIRRDDVAFHDKGGNEVVGMCASEHLDGRSPQHVRRAILPLLLPAALSGHPGITSSIQRHCFNLVPGRLAIEAVLTRSMVAVATPTREVLELPQLEGEDNRTRKRRHREG